jgi:hypothetical protein
VYSRKRRSNVKRRCSTNYYIEYEIEFTLRERVSENRSHRHLWQTYDYDRDYDDEYTIETKIEYKYREAEIIFGVIVKDKQAIEVTLSSWYL